MKSRLFKRRSTRLWFLSVSILVVVFGVHGAWSLWISRGVARAAGVYFVNGGESCIVIEAVGLRDLKVRETPGIVTSHALPVLSSRWTAQIEDGRLILRQFSRLDMRSQLHPLPQVSTLLRMDLAPSVSSRGDWDLVGAIAREMAPRILSPGYWQMLYRSRSLNAAVSALSHSIQDDAPRFLDFRLDPGTPPLRSFLHRVNDPRVAEFFRERRSARPTPRSVSLIRSLSIDRPRDPYVALHRIDVEAAVGRPEVASRLMEEWDKKNAATPDVLLAESARRVRAEIALAEAKQSAPGLPSLRDFSLYTRTASGVLHANMNLQAKLAWFRRIGSLPTLWCDDEAVGLVRNVPRRSLAKDDSRERSDSSLFSYLDVNVARTAATLHLFQGERTESLEILSGAYRVGQSWNANGSLLSRMIGIAVRTIAIDGLGLYVLNACETPEDVEEVWTTLERLDKTPGQEDGEDMAAGEFPGLLSWMINESDTRPNLEEALTRHNVADARFQILRTAAAAWHRFLKIGEFPRSDDEFDLLAGEGLPADDFASTESLRFATVESGRFRVYSVGPDSDDDQTSIEYDSTNGTLSDGDIFLTVPREREFPFPKEGVRAVSAPDLLRQFPNGLPQDPFASTEGRPLSIVDSTTADPVVVFSFGPDADERESVPPFYRSAEGSIGLSSASRTPGSRLQLIFGRTGENASTPWILARPPQPSYDPTNGATSEGDLFVEIPR
ncbi:hypothetical protein JW916_01780 [Candidatus Sumerlaeota bacterium]|nr:hypothetical protein [Candidatus Sumerlaeota bacterium]